MSPRRWNGTAPLRGVVLVSLGVAALIVVVASGFASSHPDGLVRTAQKQGFDSSAKGSATAGSPLAGYHARGVDDPVAAKGISGLVGCAVVLLLGSGTVVLVRRRPRDDEN